MKVNTVGFDAVLAYQSRFAPLEVDVYGKIVPALRLYTKYRFTFVPSLNTRSITRGSKPVSAGRL